MAALAELPPAPQGVHGACPGHRCAESPSLAWALVAQRGSRASRPARASLRSAGRGPGGCWTEGRTPGLVLRGRRLHLPGMQGAAGSRGADREPTARRTPPGEGATLRLGAGAQRAGAAGLPSEPAREHPEGEALLSARAAKRSLAPRRALPPATKAPSHGDSAPCGRTRGLAAALGDMPASTATLGGDALVWSSPPRSWLRPPSFRRALLPLLPPPSAPHTTITPAVTPLPL